jgi:Ala-tRNA(Pro) deacylase
MAIPASVRDFLSAQHVDFHPLVHRTAFTAQEEAAVTHVPGKAWAKTVVCVGDGSLLLAVLPAHHSVDLEPLRRLAGVADLRVANEREMASHYPSCEAGAMPPFGPLFGQRVFIDSALACDADVVFNAGTHADAIRMRYEALVAVSGGTIGAFSRAPGH